MSFLDNLESSLKSLESREERDPREHQRKQDERARAMAVGPWADQLKSSTFVKQLCDQAALAGHKIRTKIYMAWFDDTLRLEARQRQLELRPTPDGIVAAFIEPDREMTTQPIDLSSNPELLLKQWLGS
jgi:hypothetical protein